MFDLDLDTLNGDQLLAEFGLDRGAVSDAIEDDRARRCPDRETVLPSRRIADLDPEWPFRRPGHAAALPEFPGAVPLRPLAPWSERRAWRG